MSNCYLKLPNFPPSIRNGIFYGLDFKPTDCQCLKGDNLNFQSLSTAKVIPEQSLNESTCFHELNSNLGLQRRGPSD